MTPLGRFLVCSLCQRSIEFPLGMHYADIAKRLESHPCSSLQPLAEDAP
jgi:hypothetical protein